ncbi:asparagine synthase-related protein [Verrucosispora sp. WMMA2044]|uniref:asparagine synthase-related protein n=1 Tax=Verrucosispora sp. WMMA2044 TaxID=3016419 RepID=UPI00248BDD2B|nr:asparagine synthase-related protein [Verrucosispora sp. WMMA2044]WBB46810.1 asparagine synthase-related protein [Verrucosispora sp. WMMA2044]
MTGFAGLVSLDGRPYAERDLDGAITVLTALGADARGCWAGRTGAVAAAVASVVHCRVPEDDEDRQPWASAEAGTVVVADAVLTNRVELCRMLELRGAAAVPDSLLIAHAYTRWGADCCRRLRGDFAFAVVDGRRGGVLLARDHLGRRPLHLYQSAGWLGFGSTALAVAAMPQVPLEPDLDRAVEFLAVAQDTRRSWIRDVAPVPAASTIWITPERTQHRRYWSLDDTPRRSGSAAEHAEELRTAMDQAVRAHLRHRGGVGVMLSGGLDSTAVAATLAEQVAPARLRTYTSVPPAGWTGSANGRDTDESSLVRLLAGAHPNLAPAFVDAVGAHAIDGDDAYFAAGGTPVRNTLNMMWVRAIHQRAVTDNVSILFTGGIGNLTFSRDEPRWLVDLARAGRLIEAWREAAAWSARRGWRETLVQGVLRPMLPGSMHRLIELRRGHRSTAAQWLAASPLRPHLATTALAARIAGGIDAYRRISGLGRFVDDNAQHAEVMATLDVRCRGRVVDPTADLALIELSARQPGWARRHRGRGRAAARASMAGRVPDGIRLRVVRGAQLPDWYDRITDRRDEIRDEFAAARVDPATQELMDLPRLDALIRDWPTPDQAGDPVVARDYTLLLPRALATSKYLRWLRHYATADRRSVAAPPPQARERASHFAP